MGLTVGRKLNKSFAVRRKRHHPIETLLAGFHDSLLSMSNFILEVKNAVVFFFEGVCVCVCVCVRGGGGGGEKLENLEI